MDNVFQLVENTKKESQEHVYALKVIIGLMEVANNVAPTVNFLLIMVNAFVMKDIFKLQLDALQIVPINNISLMENANIIASPQLKFTLLEFVNVYLIMKELIKNASQAVYLMNTEISMEFVNAFQVTSKDLIQFVN
jgi:hypothetical protein